MYAWNSISCKVVGPNLKGDCWAAEEKNKNLWEIWGYVNGLYLDESDGA